MAVIDTLICMNGDGTISFGNYLLTEKKKVNDFEAYGDLYKLKTFDEITRLEKNGNLLIETLPGTVVHDFKMDEAQVAFKLERNAQVQITMELEPEKEYQIKISDINIGKFKTNMSGKLIFSGEFSETPSLVQIEKV